jgi:hypothetical protein
VVTAPYLDCNICTVLSECCTLVSARNATWVFEAVRSPNWLYGWILGMVTTRRVLHHCTYCYFHLVRHDGTVEWDRNEKQAFQKASVALNLFLMTLLRSPSEEALIHNTSTGVEPCGLQRVVTAPRFEWVLRQRCGCQCQWAVAGLEKTCVHSICQI